MSVCSLGFEEGKDGEWEIIAHMMKDMPGILEDVLHTAAQRNLKRETIDLYF